MESSLLAQGFELMLVGMGTVFVFLTTLVGATTLMASWVPKIDEPAQPPHPADGASGPSAEEIAAISAAMTRHRQR